MRAGNAGSPALAVFAVFITGVCGISAAGAFDLPPFVKDVLGQKNDDAPTIPTPDAVAYATSIDVAGNPDDLADKLKSASNLVQLEKQKASGPTGLVLRAAADAERLSAVLSALGWFDATVRIDVAGIDVSAPGAAETVARARRAGVVAVRVRVDPGRQFTMGTLRFVDADNGRALPEPADRKTLGLLPENPARSAAVVAADQVIVDTYRNRGFARATVAAHAATADHTRRTLDVTFKIRPGPKLRFGEATVRGGEPFQPDFVEARRTYRPGDLFSPEPLAHWRKELVKYDSFDSVRIRESDHLDAQGRVPVEVEVKERLRHALGFGVQYSSTDGPVVDAYYIYRNLFGGAEQIRFDIQVSRAPEDVTKFLQDYGASTKEVDRYGFKVSATFTKPGIVTVNDDLVVTPAVLREVTRAYSRDATTAAAGIKHRFTDQFSVQAGIDGEIGRATDPLALIPQPNGAPPLGVREKDYTFVGIPVDLVYDSTDRPLDPRGGVKITGGVEPFSSVLGSTTDVTLLKASAATYYAFDDDGRYIVAGRVAAASLAGASLDSIPLPRRLYVGGAGSVRGYDDQGIGPKDSFGRPTGGRSSLEASLEGRVKVTETIGVVPFVDAGSAFAGSIPNFSRQAVKFGAGLGLRYYTAIGPIRLDVARALNPDHYDPPFAVYISLGQSF